jgi:hypothetical protein
VPQFGAAARHPCYLSPADKQAKADTVLIGTRQQAANPIRDDGVNIPNFRQYFPSSGLWWPQDHQANTVSIMANDGFADLYREP